MKDKILELRAAGYTYDQIKEAVGCSKGTIAYHCSSEQKDKTLDRSRQRQNLLRREIERIKTEAVCMDCEIDYPHFMLDFDHREGVDKITNVSNVSLFSSLQKMLDEIAKCDIVCANCHRLRTWLRKTKWAAKE